MLEIIMNLEKIFKNIILLYILSTVVFLVFSFTLEKNFLGEELYLIDREIDLLIIPALEETIYIYVGFSKSNYFCYKYYISLFFILFQTYWKKIICL